MNVVKISDGLGNQMFQYAFARKLQIDTGRKVYLDTRFINNEDSVFRKEDGCLAKKNGYRIYGLDRFRIKLPSADDCVLKHWKYLSGNGFLRQEIYAMSKNGLWPWKYCDEDIMEVNSNTFFPVYYKGYFFNLRYYDDIKKILQKEFVLKSKIHLPLELKTILKNDNTVGLHIRRGDFLKLNRDISQKGYYPKALELMAQKADKPTYLIFSDDMAWVKDNLKIDDRVVYISDMGFQDYEEMMIMKHCKHHIIANSTFSYWAAYLNPNPNKVVICPRYWKTDIIPADWLSI
ncbi:MAG: alpha-1,2-fucosyltransferase [Muribaculaceae bacterium]|nr:alpha-1,2-fucosyltransferase [Muribaculaceae bacterium]